MTTVGEQSHINSIILDLNICFKYAATSFVSKILVNIIYTSFQNAFGSVRNCQNLVIKGQFNPANPTLV